jgi:hypothetical protein
MEYQVTVTAAGEAGSAVGTGITECPILGHIEYIAYDYTDAPASTTITITENGGAGRSILAVAAGNTDGVAYVRAPAVDQLNAAIAASFNRIFVPGYSLKVEVAASNPAAKVVVRIGVSQ